MMLDIYSTVVLFLLLLSFPFGCCCTTDDDKTKMKVMSYATATGGVQTVSSTVKSSSGALCRKIQL